MDKLPRLLTVFCIFAAGAAAGVLATHLPFASAAENKTVYVFGNDGKETINNVISWIVEERGILRIRGENSEHVYNCEGWDKIFVPSNQ